MQTVEKRTKLHRICRIYTDYSLIIKAHPFFQKVSVMNIKTKKAVETINVDDSEELTANFDPLITGCSVNISDHIDGEDMMLVNNYQQQFEEINS